MFFSFYNIQHDLFQIHNDNNEKLNRTPYLIHNVHGNLNTFRKFIHYNKVYRFAFEIQYDAKNF